jgi:hypothetical protein
VHSKSFAFRFLSAASCALFFNIVLLVARPSRGRSRSPRTALGRRRRSCSQGLRNWPTTPARRTSIAR